MAGVIGSPLEDLDTPVLLVDRAAMERNLRRMADFFGGRPAQLRPHFKNHKCTTLARRQMAAGSAVGITCAKLGEAEVVADAGIDDILIANQVVGAVKMPRLVEVARKANVRVAIDDFGQAEAISRTAVKAGVTVGLLIEVEIGMGRCGVDPGEPALALARRVSELKGVRFDGLQAYEGHLVAVGDREERTKRTRESMQIAVETRRLIEAAGIPVAVISGGSTSTYSITGQMDGVDEIQAGTYPTMDWMYQELSPEFEIAMSVLSRVISRPRSDAVVMDVGLKGLGHEFGPPKAKGRLTDDIQFRLSEEHCTGRGAIPDWRVGRTVELIPSHSCTTSNLYRQFHVHEEGRVVDVWPIEGSGRLT